MAIAIARKNTCVPEIVIKKFRRWIKLEISNLNSIPLKVFIFVL
ncbi:MAG: hypothetical protein N2504_03105 [candidate division WOR-3 bacterium]|nr:hypothetical protein [candidate division WOR-3 bacterium]MCX7947558.1 hypothetical protein [candidate division WOR-3 bacterium]MDW8150444.1 hypothetical protein [candidate division WOR-3 bacterium]